VAVLTAPRRRKNDRVDAGDELPPATVLPAMRHCLLQRFRGGLGGSLLVVTTVPSSFRRDRGLSRLPFLPGALRRFGVGIQIGRWPTRALWICCLPVSESFPVGGPQEVG
jgi:hypothetical protein